MSDWWGTRSQEDQWGSVKPGTGLAGFFSNPDTGPEISDRLGMISQILMNAGSGRGGAGLGEAMAGVSERSANRREYRKQLNMANRLADKLEPSNPELANMIRVNPKLGLELAGKQAMMPLEFEQESKLTKMRTDAEYQKAVDLADRKAKADMDQKRLIAKMWGLDIPDTAVAGTDESTSQAPVGDIPAATPDPNTRGTGDGTIQISPLGGQPPAVSPVSAAPDPAQQDLQPAQPEQPPAQPEQPAQQPIDDPYAINLPDNQQQAESLYRVRKKFADPDMPIEDMFALGKAAMNDDNVGFDAVVKKSTDRKEKRARVQGLQTRASAADATFQSAQGLPGINMSAPGEAEMRQAGIDPKARPDLNPAQTAERMRVAAETGAGEYNTLLGDLAKPAPAGGTIRLADGTIIQTGGAGAKDTEAQDRNEALSLRAQISLPILDDPASEAALTTGWEMYKDQALPAWLTNSFGMLSPEYRLAKVAGANYLSAILRQESLSSIKQEEFDMYGPFLLPQKGDDDATKVFKSELRQRTYQGMLRNMSPTAQLDYATKATQQRKEAIARGETPPPLPDINQWPTGTGKEGVPQPAPTGSEPGPTTKPPKAVPPMSNKAKQRGLSQYKWDHLSDAAREALSD